jgi:hypothetical protein
VGRLAHRIQTSLLTPRASPEKYGHRLFKDNIGHNAPHEASVEFAKAVIDVDRL